MPRHLQRYDMGEFVPQRGSPIEGSRLARSRRVHRNHFAKADPQRAESRQTERAYRKASMIGKDFQLNRAGRLESVALAQPGIGLFGQPGSIA